MKVILASGSPRRHRLLNMINLIHEIIPSGIEEVLDPGMQPVQAAESLAMQKGADVSAIHHNALIIAADTIVVLDGLLLGKPESPDQARSMLRQLSGRTHEVITGVALTDTTTSPHRTCVFHQVTRVTFAPLDDSEIDAYVKTGSPMDKAGSYGIQDDLGSLFVSTIEGDYYNVVGFPIREFYRQLRTFLPEVAVSILNP